jgi:hypothetical protein
LNILKTKQCDQSRDARKLETEKLWKQLSSTVSRGTLPPGEIQETISKCLYHVCGGCPGAGNIIIIINKDYLSNQGSIGIGLWCLAPLSTIRSIMQTIQFLRQKTKKDITEVFELMAK